jgi:hypothetical protein
LVVAVVLFQRSPEKLAKPGTSVNSRTERNTPVHPGKQEQRFEFLT